MKIFDSNDDDFLIKLGVNKIHTRVGKEVKIHLIDNTKNYPISGYVGRIYYEWTSKGRFVNDKVDHYLDLFIDEK
jgi:uncharacterized membrane protein YgcG